MLSIMSRSLEYSVQTLVVAVIDEQCENPSMPNNQKSNPGHKHSSIYVQSQTAKGRGRQPQPHHVLQCKTAAEPLYLPGVRKLQVLQ